MKKVLHLASCCFMVALFALAAAPPTAFAGMTMKELDLSTGDLAGPVIEINVGADAKSAFAAVQDGSYNPNVAYSEATVKLTGNIASLPPLFATSGVSPFTFNDRRHRA